MEMGTSLFRICWKMKNQIKAQKVNNFIWETLKVHVLKFGMKTMPIQLFVWINDDVDGRPSLGPPLKEFQFNTVVEWNIRGSSGHAFHLHVWHMQVCTAPGF